MVAKPKAEEAPKKKLSVPRRRQRSVPRQAPKPDSVKQMVKDSHAAHDKTRIITAAELFPNSNMYNFPVKWNPVQGAEEARADARREYAGIAGGDTEVLQGNSQMSGALMAPATRELYGHV